MFHRPPSFFAEALGGTSAGRAARHPIFWWLRKKMKTSFVGLDLEQFLQGLAASSGITATASVLQGSRETEADCSKSVFSELSVERQVSSAK